MPVTVGALYGFFVERYGEGAHVVVGYVKDGALRYVPKVPKVATDKDGSTHPYFGSIFLADETEVAADSYAETLRQALAVALAD